MEKNILSLAASAAAAAIWTYFGHIIMPVGVLLFVMVCDYITGIISAWVNRQLKSRVGIVGICKKVGYLFIVAVGCVIDYLLSIAGDTLGLTDSVRFVSLLVIFWLIINELISILENVREMGVKTPPWLGGLLDRLQQRSEAAAPHGDTEQTEGKHERH